VHLRQRLASNKIVIDYAGRYGKGGNSVILGTPLKVHAPHAAFANGALAHAFEMDSLVQPGVGAHPGAQEIGASGKGLITAFVAGAEVLYRIGAASPPQGQD
jgi:2-methylcitrate dehydratase PrpD